VGELGVGDLRGGPGRSSAVQRLRPAGLERACQTLTARGAAFPDRSLADQRFPYVFVDATYCKARVNRRVVSQAVVVATGVAGDGHREVLGFAIGDSQDGAFWTAFLRS